jgi:hypothetical protein
LLQVDLEILFVRFDNLAGHFRFGHLSDNATRDLQVVSSAPHTGMSCLQPIHRQLVLVLRNFNQHTDWSELYLIETFGSMADIGTPHWKSIA